MSPDFSIPDHEIISAELRFASTIDRAMVNRAAVSEVFLTDVRAVDQQTVLVAAQLPRWHGYFNDHTMGLDDIDPLLLFEVAQQAILASAHSLKVPRIANLVCRECDLEIYDLAAFDGVNGPAAVTIESVFDWISVQDGHPAKGHCKQEISIGGCVVATHLAFGHLMNSTQMQTLREQERGDPPPWTAQMADRPCGVALPPAQVGRVNPLNVVLTRLEIGDEIARAIIAPPWQNRALFDHSYDHLATRILVEAARQLAILVISRAEPADADRWVVRSVKGRFGQFAEIDLPVAVKTSLPNPLKDHVAISVDVVQAGQEIATIELGLIRRPERAVT